MKLSLKKLRRLILRQVIPGLLIFTQLLSPAVLSSLAANTNSYVAGANGTAPQSVNSSSANPGVQSDPFGYLSQISLYEIRYAEAEEELQRREAEELIRRAEGQSYRNHDELIRGIEIRDMGRSFDRELMQVAFTQGNKGKVTRMLSMKDFRQEWKGDEGVSDSIELYHPRVDLSSSQWSREIALNTFNIKNRSALMFGNYLVFVEIQNNGEEILSLIDLETYQRELGQTRVPILRLPLTQDLLKGKNLMLSQESGKRVLLIGDKRLSHSFIDHFVKTQSVYHNMLANLHNPATYAATKATIEDLDHFIGQNLELAVNELKQDPDASDIEGPLAKAFDNKYATFLRSELEKVKADKAFLKQKSEARKEAIERGEVLPKSKKDVLGRDIKETVVSDFEVAAKQFAESQAKNKKVFSRIRFLVSKLQSYSPLANRNLGKVYDHLASKGKLGAELFRAHQETILRVSFKSHQEALKLSERAKREHPLRDDLLKAGLAAGASTLLLYSPIGEPLVQAMSPLIQSTASWFAQFWDISAKGVEISTAFIHKAGQMWDRITAPEQVHLWKWRLGVGVPALLGSVVTLCHFIPISMQIYKDWRNDTGNSFKKLKDWIKGTWELSSRGASYAETDEHWKKLIDGFKNAVAGFPDFLVKRQTKDAAQYDETLSKTMKIKKRAAFTPEDDAKVVESIQSAEKNSGWVMKLLSGFGADKKKYERKEIDSFTRAIVHAFCSMSAFTNAHRDALAPFYNKLFYVRSYLRFPLMDWMWIRYPDSIRVAMQKDGEVVLPTDMNGGLRSRFEKWSLAFKARRGSLDYDQLKAWEAAIVDVEKSIEVKALNEAFKLLMENAKSRDILRDFYATGGIEKVSDDTIFDLAKEHRVLFEGLYRTVSEGMLKEFLLELAEKKAGFLEKSGIDPSNATLKDLKNLTLGFSKELNSNCCNVDALYERAAKRVDLRSKANETIENATWIDRYRWEAARKLDPKGSRLTNRQAGRIHSTRTQLKNPAAVLRAVRSAITELLVDKPIEIAQMILFLIAVTMLA